MAYYVKQGYLPAHVDRGGYGRTPCQFDARLVGDVRGDESSATELHLTLDEFDSPELVEAGVDLHDGSVVFDIDALRAFIAT